MHKALQEFHEGTLLMIVGVPHKCPVAPLEFEAMADWTESVFADCGIEGEVFFNPDTIDAENRAVYTLEGEDVL